MRCMCSSRTSLRAARDRASEAGLPAVGGRRRHRRRAGGPSDGSSGTASFAVDGSVRHWPLQQKLALRGSPPIASERTASILMLSCCASARPRAQESQDTAAAATGVGGEAGGSDQRWTCVRCGERFPSGTQLHLHLADTGHAVGRELLPAPGPPPLPPANADFHGYYTAQTICSPAEWAAAYARFAEPLPRDFRLSVHSHGQAAAAALRLLNAQGGTGLEPAGGSVTVPGTAWRVGRRNEATKRLMLAAQDCGLLHRQVCSRPPSRTWPAGSVVPWQNGSLLSHLGCCRSWCPSFRQRCSA